MVFLLYFYPVKIVSILLVFVRTDNLRVIMSRRSVTDGRKLELYGIYKEMILYMILDMTKHIVIIITTRNLRIFDVKKLAAGY